MLGFSRQLPIPQQNAVKLICGRDLGYTQLSHEAATSLPSCSHPMVFNITSEMYGFSHQFPIA